MNKNFLHKFKRKSSWRLPFFLIIFFLIFALFISYTKAAPSLSLTLEPSSESSELPSTSATATADTGNVIESASYQIYPSSGAPTGIWNDCTADSGSSFNQNIVDFTCTVPSLSDGSYKMNIKATDNNAVEISQETSAFIVDRLPPVVSFDDLTGGPLLIDYNNPVFTGSVSDALTSVVLVEYKWTVASTTASVPGTFGDSGWSACSIGGAGTNVTFNCNPGTTFPDSVKGDEYRMHVRATDNVSNLSGYTNYYKFQVDTMPPHTLAITYPDAAGITLYGAHSYNITWVAPVDDFELGSQPIKLEYSSNGAFTDTQLIIDNLGANGPYSWLVPSALSTATAKVRITATDLAGNSFTSTSANPFTVVPYSAPVVSINSITNNISATVPINFTASANDVQNIASARYRIDSGSWVACTAQDGTFDSTSENLNCSSVTVTQGTHTIEVEATDVVGDSGTDSYVFTYDATNPVVDAGTLGTINLLKAPGATATDAHSSIVSRAWIKISGPGIITFGGGSSITNPSISADTNGDYVARLEACDLAGHCASDTVSFTWTDVPLSFSITEPSGGERLIGGNNFTITWTNPGGSSSYTYNISYSVNGGTNWTSVVTGIARASLSYNWSLPVINSETVTVKVDVLDTGDAVILNDISSSFTIDSSAPTVDAGTLATISTPTAPGATASDNFDSGAQLVYSWTSISGSGTLSFGGGTNILDPTLSGTITGTYVARLTVTDRAGNSASDDVSFYWDGNPPNFSVLNPVNIFYKGGSVEPIVWTASAGTDHYTLEYTLNNGVDFVSISASTLGTATTSGLYYDWTIPVSDSNEVYVRVSAYDIYNNNSSAVSSTFSIDSTAPVVDAGTLDLISSPATPQASASDGAGSGIATYSWTQLSGAGTITFGGGSNILNPLISADQSSTYEVRLLVTDNLGQASSDTVTFYYSIEPPAPVISSPGIEEVWAGDASKNIRWEIADPGDLDNFLISYTLNDGISWSDISTVASSTRLLNWSVPLENTIKAQVRVVVTDVDGYSATSTRPFVIDSIAPVISIGSIGTTTTAATSGTIVTDNIDSESELTFIWNGVGAPIGGTLVFTPTHTIMDPALAGTVSGEYIAQIVAKDRAGHISQSLLTFFWDGDPDIPIVTSPTSTVFVQGGETQNIDWYIPANSELDYFALSHSLDNGTTWNSIATTSSSTRTFAWSIPIGMNSDSSQSSIVEVRAYDIYLNESVGLSPNFTIDSVAPVVNAGSIVGPINSPTVSTGAAASDNLDSGGDLTVTWSVLALPYPQATLTISDPSTIDSYFSGNMSGEYEVLLTVSDRANNIATSSLAFTWDSLYDPVLTAPSAGDVLRGGVNTTLSWTLTDPGDLDHLETQYSIDNGVTWNTINLSVATSSRELVWLVPNTINSTSSQARLMTVNDVGIKATSTSPIFIIDSTSPILDAGLFSGLVNVPTTPGASASDNIDSTLELSYLWSQQSAPSGGTIAFGGGTNILNSAISGDRNGNYVARLTVNDRAGNSSTDTVSFERYIGSTGGGGGGGGGSTGSVCVEVTYGDYGVCFNDIQYRSVIATVPEQCTLSEAQKLAQERSCSEATYCESVTYGDYGACIEGFQYREIVSTTPEQCTISEMQLSAREKSCEVVVDKGPFDADALLVMEEARRNFAYTDKEMLKRVTGQILIQVEEFGRAWYVSALDQKRYYLGSPANAFSVMSLIGLGVKNDRLAKIPVGLLDGSLSQDKDSDGDGLPDRLEEGLLSNPFKKDTDGDGYDDKTEVLGGFNLNGPGKINYDTSIINSSLGHIYIQVETNGEAWYVEPRVSKRFYLGRPNEAFAIMREFGLGITNEDINKIPVGQFSAKQLERITKMLDDRKRELEARR